MPQNIPAIAIVTRPRGGFVFPRFVRSWLASIPVRPCVIIDASVDSTMPPEYLSALHALNPARLGVFSRQLTSVEHNGNLAAAQALAMAREHSPEANSVLFCEDDILFASDFWETVLTLAGNMPPKLSAWTLFHPKGGYRKTVVVPTEFEGAKALLLRTNACKLIAEHAGDAATAGGSLAALWGRLLASRGLRVQACRRSLAQQHYESASAGGTRSSRFYEPDPSELDVIYPADYYQWLAPEAPDYEMLGAELHRLFRPARVLDIGAGGGFLLGALSRRGVEIEGIEGSLPAFSAMDPGVAKHVHLHDLRSAFKTRPADLVTCTEVASEMPAATIDTLFETLATHTQKYCYFTASPPGQGGHNQINPQPPAFWIERAREFGLHLDSSLTSKLAAVLRRKAATAWWLAANSLVFRPGPTVRNVTGAPPIFDGIDTFQFLNLRDRPDRRVLVTHQLRIAGASRHSIRWVEGERVEACGGIGCTRAHIRALEHSIKENYAYHFVLEDDFEWLASLPEVKKAWAEARELEWDVLMLSTCVHQSHPIGGRWHRGTSMSSSAGMIVRRHYFPVLLAEYRESVAKLEAAPHRYSYYAMDQHWKPLQQRDTWLVSLPRFGTQRGDVSNIDHTWLDHAKVLEENMGQTSLPRPDPRWKKLPLRVRQRCKAGFLFLTMGDGNHPRIWEEYFAGYADEFRIFTHAKHPPRVKSLLLKRGLLPATVPTKWGTLSLVRAERALLQEALRDSDLTHFVLLSESCVPVKPFHHLLKSLGCDGKSVLSWQTVSDARTVNPGKVSRFEKDNWIPVANRLFHSQWWILNREAAELFVKYPDLDAFEPVFAPDECAVGTILSLSGYDIQNRIHKRDSTWTRWPKQIAGHPDTLTRVSREVAAELISSPCFFARKFAPNSNIGRYRLHLSGDPAHP